MQSEDDRGVQSVVVVSLNCGGPDLPSDHCLECSCVTLRFFFQFEDPIAVSKQITEYVLEYVFLVYSVQIVLVVKYSSKTKIMLAALRNTVPRFGLTPPSFAVSFRNFSAGKSQFLPFAEAREYVRKLGLKNSYEWLHWSKHERPRNLIPSTPYKVYKDSGWKGY